MLKSGDALGDYEIVSHVTSGGMAALYLGRRSGARGFAKSVAIKVVHERLSEEEDIQRMFVDEAILSSHLSHPNIVHVEGFGESAKHLYLVMEYVDGCSLTDLLKHLHRHGRMLAVSHAVRVAIEVAAGLHAAHESVDNEGRPLKVVHRDVSPGNVLMSKAGHIKMIDFGIATSAAQANESIEGNFKGKFRYMSPEQASGKPLDRRSDVYSLGLVLWELLTGKPALRSGTNLGILELARSPKIAAPSTIREEGIGQALDEAVLWALGAEPDDRPATAKEFRRRLVQACPEALAVESETMGELVRSVPPRRKRSQTPSPPSLDELVVRSTSTVPPAVHESTVPVPSSPSPALAAPGPAARPSVPPPPQAPLAQVATGQVPASSPAASPSSPVSSAPASGGPSAPADEDSSHSASEPSFASDALTGRIQDGRKSMVDMMLDQLPDFSSASSDPDQTIVEPNVLEHLPDLSDPDATFADPNFEEKVAEALRGARGTSAPPPRGRRRTQDGVAVKGSSGRPSAPGGAGRTSRAPRRRPQTVMPAFDRKAIWRFVALIAVTGVIGFVGTALTLIALQW